MSKVKCPECYKKYINQEFMERHADAEHKDWREPKARGWATPYGFIDFFFPVTYEHACATGKRLAEKYKDELTPK